MQVTLVFNTKSKVGFLNDKGKPERFASDVLRGEKVFFFDDIIKASNTTLYLKCSDGQTAFVALKDLQNINIEK